MTKDRFYSQIIEALAKPLDPHAFEQAAADLLRSIYPSLVPVPGGSDDGMDGAIASVSTSPIPLICTTSKDVSGNLRRSLKRYKIKGHTARLAVSATSQSLTRLRMNNLEKTAKSEGFHLISIHERTAMAGLLYRSPRWCKDLLGLTGSPPALSALPRTVRPLLGQPVIGRDPDLRWLRTTPGDLLLSGQGGSGKTFVLNHLTDNGLFVASEDLSRIAADLRELMPGVLLVDDAHLKLDLLEKLRRLRDETGADFRIVADCWPGAVDDVATAMMLSKHSCRELPLLTRDQIVQVIGDAGIRTPVPLVRELVNQAAGRPGLAVTLTHLCVTESVEEVAVGVALAKDVSRTFKPLVGEEAITILAAFAVGGRAGMSIDAVALHMGTTPAAIRHKVAKLAAGGVVTELPRGELCVQPVALSCALVRDVFFGGSVPLEVGKLLGSAPNFNEATRVLIGARSRGAEVPDTLLRPRLGSGEMLREYANLGAEECNWVVREHPLLLGTLASAALHYVPNVAITMLMEAGVAVVDDPNPWPGHALRQITDWIQGAKPGSPEVERRRSAVMDAVELWIGNGKDLRVAVKIGVATLSPHYHASELDPGLGRVATLTRGLIGMEQLEIIRAMWRRLQRVLPIPSLTDFEPIQQAIRQYVFPYAGDVRMPTEYTNACHTLAREMLADLSSLAKGRPGVLSEASAWAEHLGVQSESEVDAEYAVLFPRDTHGKDGQERRNRDADAAAALADRWMQLPPADVARRLARCLAEAVAVGVKYPSWSDDVCCRIAACVPNPEQWAATLLEVESSVHCVEPFLRRSAALSRPGWEGICRRCLADPRFELAGLSTALTSDSTSDKLLDHALSRLRGWSNAIETWCIRGEIPIRQLKRLLSHPDSAIAGAAAVGEWHASPEKSVRAAVEQEWLEAILNSGDGDVYFVGIFEGRPDMAAEWLARRLRESPHTSSHDYNVTEAINALDEKNRRELVPRLPTSMWPGAIIAQIIGADMEAYRLLLARKEAKALQLGALHGEMDEAWVEKAILALDAGHRAEDVSDAPRLGIELISGSESEHWERWICDYTRLKSHPDNRIQEVARIGIECAQRNRDRAAKEERREAVFGDR